MTPVIQEIETAVTQLTLEQLADFRAWFADYDAQRWDQQFETDATAGCLDALAAEALAGLRIDRQEWFQLADQAFNATYGDESTSTPPPM